MLHAKKELQAFYKFTHLDKNMKWAHKITISVFAKPEEQQNTIKEALEKLVPFNLEQAKIKTETQKAESFDDRIIEIHKITLTKESHTNDFLQFLLDTLTQEQKDLLLSQAESRLDAEYDYFIRIDKQKWIEDRQIWLTDSGNCYHIKITLAAYPKNREKALDLVKKLFVQKNI